MKQQPPTTPVGKANQPPHRPTALLNFKKTDGELAKIVGAFWQMIWHNESPAIEQKAVCILPTLLHLGIKDMRLGPSLPAFVGPNVLQILVDPFNLTPTSTPEEGLKAILGT